MPSINVPSILASHGPPGEWSGGVAGTLSPEERQAVLQAWRSMSAEERNTIMQKFREQWAHKKEADTEADTERWKPRALQAGGGLGEGLLAAKMAPRAAERLLGVQRFVHGTSEAARRSILREGLDPAHGGSPLGSGQAIGSEDFVRRSKGKIHVAKDLLSGRAVARAHASLTEAQHAARIRGAVLDRGRALLAYTRGMASMRNKGIVGGALPFEKFKHSFEPDPDMRGAGWRTSEPIGPEHLTRGRAGLRQIIKSRTSGPQLLQYAKNNPGRAGVGVLGAVAVGALGVDAASRIFSGHGLLHKKEASRGQESAGVLQRPGFQRAANRPLERLPYHGALLVPKTASAPPVASKEQREAAARADTHFRSPDKGKWGTFIENAKRKSFVKAVQQDLRSDPKLERHADQMNRLMTGKVLGEVQGRTGKYSIIRLRGGGLGCTCADWRYKKSVSPTGEQDCKHIREWKRANLRKEAGVSLDRDRCALKMAEASKFNWKWAREGLRDEGLPMAGLVGGTAAGNRLLPGGEGALLGGGMGYAAGALANLGLDRFLPHKGKPKLSAVRGLRKTAEGVSTVLPGAVGATLGAALGGGMASSDKTKSRNMLAGGAIGYGLGDAYVMVRKLLHERAVNRAATGVLHALK